MSGRKRFGNRSSSVVPGPSKRSRLEDGGELVDVKATGRFSTSKVRGIEWIPRDKIPVACIGDSEAAQSHRRDFFLRQRTRLIAEGKLVKPGKEMCKFFPHGASLEWEGIPGSEAVTPPESMSKDTIYVDSEPSDQESVSSCQEMEGGKNMSNTQLPSSCSLAPIIISDHEEDTQRRGRCRKLNARLNRKGKQEYDSVKAPDSTESSLSGTSDDVRRSDSRNISLHQSINVPVPKGSYARGRRILIQEQHFVTVSMRGDLQYFDITRRVRDKALSDPWDPQNGRQHVEDACSVDGYGIIAFNHGASQAVVVDETKKVLLKQKPHEGGVSSLCGMEKSGSRIRFLSGGHDHTVRIWTVDTSAGFTTKVERLRISHSSLVHALAWIPIQKHAISASCRTVLLYDMEKKTQITKGLSSNAIYQMHVQADHPHVMATEVDHLDRQINIYDIRQGFGAPNCEIGHRNDDSRKPSRYERGSFVGSMFTRGFRDGTIKVFDIRNPNQSICSTLTRRETPVEHTILWKDSTVIAFGSTAVSFLDFLYS